jgi:hypothetical protein
MQVEMVEQLVRKKKQADKLNQQLKKTLRFVTDENHNLS